MEKFEPQKMPEWNDEEKFRQYMEDLKLMPEDFNKRILDVGADSAQFARWAKEHNVSSEIYSVEPQVKNLAERGKSVAALAESLPFADESFDLVVSRAAIPNMYSLGYSKGNFDTIKEKVKGKISQAFFEMARVLKKDGEIRLAPVLIRNDQKHFYPQALSETLEELQEKHGMRVNKIRMPSRDVYEYKKHGKKKGEEKLLAEAYLLILHKKKNTA